MVGVGVGVGVTVRVRVWVWVTIRRNEARQDKTITRQDKVK